MTSGSLTKEQKREKAIERIHYSTICKQPPPPGLSPCEEAKWDLTRLKTCLSLREEFSNKWYDQDSGHMIEIQNTRKAVENAQKRVKQL